ncbi:glycosyltransferase family 4 protein [Velocimicrobium porci]|uniref:Glycosyltransferase family 4 protein n=1 Tax=Velocimicrobium porci TaxID=2606634 RepID=A0A6L5Y2Y8_9FIRM|nr:glycosyltransferase family 1 protein [Velocimicrobium porci]MSS64493.1 glycosyltransferase family 4 protein [Velocimicrobium porci]
MRIAFDIQPLLNNSKSGVGFYEHGLVTELVNKKKEDQFYLQFFSYKNREEKRKIAKRYLSNNTEMDECTYFPGSLYRVLMSFIYFPYHFFFKKQAEITHFFNFCIPPGVKGKKVVTIHDMTFRAYPGTMRWKTKMVLALNIKKSIRRADKIIADSEFTKKEMQKYYSVNETKIAVVPCGIDFNIFHTEYNDDTISEVKTKYKITGDYFLYLGTLEPRKNIEGLIKAYAIFCKKHSNEAIPKLVLAGGKGWNYETIFSAVKEYSLEERIYFTGYVADEDVPKLMAGAYAFCFPSFYEGFGMPPLEAMACGTPVLTSNNSSLTEVTADAAFKVNPNSIEEIADGLEVLWQDKQLYHELRKKGIEQAKKYSWENAANLLYNVYKEL